MAQVEVIKPPPPVAEVVLRMSEDEAKVLGALLGNLGHWANASPGQAYVVVSQSKTLRDEAAANGGYVHNGILGNLAGMLSRAGFGAQ